VPVPRALSSTERRELEDGATEVLQRADARYSGFRVGAAVLTESGQIFAGCNVESDSYGLTMCAERSAIFQSVAAEGPESRVRAVAVVSEAGAMCSPCGACRQVIFERGPDARVVFHDGEGAREESISALLPWGFRLK